MVGIDRKGSDVILVVSIVEKSALLATTYRSYSIVVNNSIKCNCFLFLKMYNITAMRPNIST